MGKGDKKTKKGKIAMGSFGVSRPRPASQKTAAAGSKKASGAKKAAPKKGAKAADKEK